EPHRTDRLARAARPGRRVADAGRALRAGARVRPARFRRGDEHGWHSRPARPGAGSGAGRRAVAIRKLALDLPGQRAGRFARAVVEQARDAEFPRTAPRLRRARLRAVRGGLRLVAAEMAGSGGESMATIGCALGGIVAGFAYWQHGRRAEHPIADLTLL